MIRGIFLGKLMVFSDVTQSVLYQEQLLANRNQLEELHSFKDRLFAVVTHDIRDPLALLVSLTEIIEEDFIDPESEESEIFREISSQVRDTHLLVGNLLDWVRSQGEDSFPSACMGAGTDGACGGQDDKASAGSQADRNDGIGSSGYFCVC